MSPTDRAKGTSTSRRNTYPSHWPVHVTGMAEARQPLPQPGPAPAVATTPSSVDSADGGELAAAPWIGLHYASEGT